MVVVVKVEGERVMQMGIKTSKNQISCRTAVCLVLLAINIHSVDTLTVSA